MSEEQVRDEGVRQLYELTRRVHSSANLAEVLQEIAAGVVEVLGFGVAAISEVDGDDFVTTAVAGSDSAMRSLMGRRTPVRLLTGELAVADDWGILRFVPHDRIGSEVVERAWIPDVPVSAVPNSWHPHDALYAPLYSATGEMLGSMAVDEPPGGLIPQGTLREMLSMFVVQAGLALARARQREELAARVRLAETVKKVAAAGSLLSPERTLENAAATIGDGLRASEVLIRTFDRDAGGRLVQWPGLPRRAVPDLGELRRAARLLAHSGGEPLVAVAGEGVPGVAAIYDAGRIRGLLDLPDEAHLAVVPLVAGGDVLGCLVATWMPPLRHPDHAEVTVLAEICREIGRQLQQVRLFESERQVVSELRELDRYRTELIATISHELRTPLTSIVGHAELLEGEFVASDSGRASVAAIVRNADRLHRLTASLLDYSRVQEPSTHIAHEVDLVEIVRGSLERLAPVAERAGLHLRVVHGSPRMLIFGDAHELAVVTDNLIGNAVKYTADGGSVCVETRVHADAVELVVSDDGMGISAADIDSVFTAFNRSSNPVAQSIPGTGLGLAIARRIVDLHGGAITVRSQLGEGSTFVLRLPRISPAGGVPGAASA